MKKLALLFVSLAFVLGSMAQTRKGDASLMGNLGYQSNYERFGIGLQARYAILNNVRIAPEVNFFFPKDKVTGLDVNVNFHYVFNFKADGQGFQVYPLVGVGMQTNFYGKRTVTFQREEYQESSHTQTDFAFSLGGGITLPLSSKCYLNAETKFMMGDKDNLVFMLGYGWYF